MNLEESQENKREKKRREINIESQKDLSRII